MRNIKQLDSLIANDNSILIKQLHIVSNEKDVLHVERKQQQRAITTNMMLLTLNYGTKKYSYQDIRYTLLDRNLLNTSYEKYSNKLRGLTIIGNWIDQEFYLITCYWDFLIKSRKRY